MNLKRAKKLRRICKTLAFQEFKGDQEKMNTFMITDYTENERNRKIHVEYEMEHGDFKLQENGERIVKDSYPICAGTLTLKHVCFRGMYQNMKKKFLSTRYAFENV